LDVTSPANIALLGDYAIPGEISDSRKVGDVLYLVTHQSSYCWNCDAVANTRVASFDVSNPASPVFAGSYPTSGSGRRLAVKGPLVYVADGPAGLWVLNVSTPAKATVVGAYKTDQPARDVAVTDSLVFVVIGALRTGSAPKEDGEVLILRQSSQ
jgi:hypothetical protein